MNNELKELSELFKKFKMIAIIKGTIFGEDNSKYIVSEATYDNLESLFKMAKNSQKYRQHIFNCESIFLFFITEDSKLLLVWSIEEKDFQKESLLENEEDFYRQCAMRIQSTRDALENGDTGIKEQQITEILQMKKHINLDEILSEFYN